MKINNWLNNFKRTQNIKAENNKFLKNFYLKNIIDSIDRDLLNHKSKLMNVKLNSDNISEIKEEIRENYLHLEKLISIQKGRITKQIRENNREKKDLDIALSVIFGKLDKLERKLLIKNAK